MFDDVFKIASGTNFKIIGNRQAGRWFCLVPSIGYFVDFICKEFIF